MNNTYSNRDLSQVNTYTHVDLPIAGGNDGLSFATWADKVDFGITSDFGYNSSWVQKGNIGGTITLDINKSSATY